VSPLVGRTVVRVAGALQYDGGVAPGYGGAVHWMRDRPPITGIGSGADLFS
jgi:hypothetical protein